jgi:hypothetical protein
MECRWRGIGGGWNPGRRRQHGRRRIVVAMPSIRLGSLLVGEMQAQGEKSRGRDGGAQPTVVLSCARKTEVLAATREGGEGLQSDPRRDWAAGVRVDCDTAACPGTGKGGLPLEPLTAAPDSTGDQPWRTLQSSPSPSRGNHGCSFTR